MFWQDLDSRPLSSWEAEHQPGLGSAQYTNTHRDRGTGRRAYTPIYQQQQQPSFIVIIQVNLR